MPVFVRLRKKFVSLCGFNWEIIIWKIMQLKFMKKINLILKNHPTLGRLELEI